MHGLSCHCLLKDLGRDLAIRLTLRTIGATYYYLIKSLLILAQYLGLHLLIYMEICMLHVACLYDMVARLLLSCTH